MFVSRRRYNAVVDEKTALKKRNGQIVAMVMNATVCLVPVFGRLESLGTDDDDVVLLYRAQDGLADLALFPADGAIIVSDPNGSVERVIVTLDEDGNLDADELKRIRSFRAEVLFTKQYGGQVAGRVSLVRRSDSAQ